MCTCTHIYIHIQIGRKVSPHLFFKFFATTPGVGTKRNTTKEPIFTLTIGARNRKVVSQKLPEKKKNPTCFWTRKGNQKNAKKFEVFLLVLGEQMRSRAETW